MVLSKTRVFSKTKNLKKNDKLYMICADGRILAVADHKTQAAALAVGENADCVIEVTVKTIFEREVEHGDKH